MTEEIFQGSVLENRIKNASLEEFKTYKSHAQIAYNRNKKSKFWQDAIDLINKHKLNKNV